MIGVFGGTFDPVHFGHLRVALEVQQALGLEQLRLLPLRVAVHREQPLASGAQRLRMLELAIAGRKGWVADGRELERELPSWTVHSLESLHQDFPEEKLCLLLGTDAYQGFLSWREPDRILELAHLVVMQRPGYVLPENSEIAVWTAQRVATSAEELHQLQAGRVYFQSVTQLGISSSDIRKHLQSGHSASYLLPDAVEHYIREQGLYA